jgi:hypothetical protein
MFIVLLGSIFSKCTFLESFPSMNDGAMVGCEAVNWAGGYPSLRETGAKSQDVVAVSSEPLGFVPA